MQSMKEIISGMSNTVNAELSSKKSLTAYTASLVTSDISLENIHTVIEHPTLKHAFLLTWLGFEKDASFTNNAPNWNPRES